MPVSQSLSEQESNANPKKNSDHLRNRSVNDRIACAGTDCPGKEGDLRVRCNRSKAFGTRSEIFHGEMHG